MSFLTLEFSILFIKALNIDFPLKNIDFPKFLNEIAASLNDFSNRWCKKTDALKE